MKRGDIALIIGVAVTVVTTLAHQGSVLGAVVVGTGSGMLAVGVVILAFETFSGR